MRMTLRVVALFARALVRSTYPITVRTLGIALRVQSRHDVAGSRSTTAAAAARMQQQLVIEKGIVPIITIHRVCVAFVRAQECFDLLLIVLRVDEDHRVLLEDRLVAQCGIGSTCTRFHSHARATQHGIKGTRTIALVHLQL